MEIIVRFVAIAYGISSLGDVDGTVRHHLDVLSMKDTVLFLGHHVLDPCLLSFEIVSYLLHGI